MYALFVLLITMSCLGSSFEKTEKHYEYLKLKLEQSNGPEASKLLPVITEYKKIVMAMLEWDKQYRHNPLIIKPEVFERKKVILKELIELETRAKKKAVHLANPAF